MKRNLKQVDRQEQKEMEEVEVELEEKVHINQQKRKEADPLDGENIHKKIIIFIKVIKKLY